MARIFICTLGGAPAVVTETLWALAKRSPPWVPDKIEIITTSFGMKLASLALQVPHGHLVTIYGEQRVPSVSVMAPGRPDLPEQATVEVYWPGGDNPPPDPSSLPPADLAIADIVTEADANVMGDLIKDRLWAASSNEDEVHVSIAGGRKTMSAHALLALAIFGNRGDEASHVLVAPEFENNNQFWHPSQAGGKINTTAEIFAARQNKRPLPPPTLDPQDAAASLRLIPTPTPLIAAVSSDRKKLSQLKMSEIMAQLDLANVFHRNPEITIDTTTNSISVCGVTRRFPIVSFIQFRLLAAARTTGWACEHDKPDDKKGWVSMPRLRWIGDTEFEALDLLSKWHHQAWQVALGDDRNPSHLTAVAEQQLFERDSPEANNKRTEFLHALPQRLQRLRTELSKGVANPETIIQLMDDAWSWLKSFHHLKNYCEGAFGLALSRDLVTSKGSRSVSPRGIHGLNCPADRITIL